MREGNVVTNKVSRIIRHEFTQNRRIARTVTSHGIFLIRYKHDHTTSADQWKRHDSPRASHGQVFDEVQPTVASALEGHRVCVFAYGQTGSGKTHTMEGPKKDR